MTDHEVSIGFQGVAEALLVSLDLGSPDADAVLRTAVGRFYYSLFWAARDYVRRTEPGRVRDGGTHQDLWSAFQGDPMHRRVEVIGRQLLDLRVLADYRSLGANPVKSAETARRLCARGLEAVATLGRR